MMTFLIILLGILLWFILGTIIVATNDKLSEIFFDENDSTLKSLSKVFMGTGLLGILIALISFFYFKTKEINTSTTPTSKQNNTINPLDFESLLNQRNKLLNRISTMENMLNSATKLTKDNIGDKVYPVDNSYAFFTDNKQPIGYDIRPAGTSTTKPMKCIVASEPYIADVFSDVKNTVITKEFVDVFVVDIQKNISMLNYFNIIEK